MLFFVYVYVSLQGDGKCPFGNKCFYKHALPNGDLVDVGCPKKARKMHRSNNEIINLLDVSIQFIKNYTCVNIYSI